MPKDPKLIPLMEEMADLTKPECRKCPKPLSCCEVMYCETARHYALEEWGVELEDTGHETLPFMGPRGCVVEPHLRPLCTLHTCQINGIGTSGDADWDRRYAALKKRIDDLEFPDDVTIGD